MATYTYSQATIGKTVQNLRKVRFWVCGIAAAVLIIDFFLAFDQTSWVAEHWRLSRSWLDTAFIVPFVLIVQCITNLRHARKSTEGHMRNFVLELSPEGVSIEYSGFVHRQHSRGEILRAEEPSIGAGLYLRTPNRYRWTVIPRRLDGYEEIKSELGAFGIPIERTVIPPNFEEYLLMLGFCASLICSLALHDRRILVLNLFAAFLIGFAGFFLISANPDNLSRMRWTRFAAFLPAVFAALTFFL